MSNSHHPTSREPPHYKKHWSISYETDGWVLITQLHWLPSHMYSHHIHHLHSTRWLVLPQHPYPGCFIPVDAILHITNIYVCLLGRSWKLSWQKSTVCLYKPMHGWHHWTLSVLCSLPWSHSQMLAKVVELLWYVVLLINYAFITIHLVDLRNWADRSLQWACINQWTADTTGWHLSSALPPDPTYTCFWSCWTVMTLVA